MFLDLFKLVYMINLTQTSTCVRDLTQGTVCQMTMASKQKQATR